MNMPKLALTIAGFSGAIAVALGAFGAHGLKHQLSAQMLEVYQTAVQYHFYHTIALLIVGLSALKLGSNGWFDWSIRLMIVGIIVFSGSLYVLAVTEERWLGAITPIGGVAFILAWLAFAIAVWRTSF